MSFKVEWSSRALKQARRLDDITRARVLAAINKFAASGQGDVKRLQGTTNVYRLRVGDWRILFEVDAAMGRISIEAVKNRGEAH